MKKNKSLFSSFKKPIRVVHSLLLLNVFIFTPNAMALPLLNGYALPMPNQFWPNTTSAIFTGTLEQQNSNQGNPDVYCDAQGNNYRLPAAGEILAKHRSLNPWGPSPGVTPGHFSNYENNDITKPRLPNISERAIGAGVINEWGDLDSYDSFKLPGLKQFFWVTETSIIDVNVGRQVINLKGELSDESYVFRDPENNLWSVICVSDIKDPVTIPEPDPDPIPESTQS